MNPHHTYFMQRAIALAHQGKFTPGAAAFGALIVRDNTIIAAVHNTVKESQDCTQHAELKAIQIACKVLDSIDLSGCVLYTSCEPCLMCLEACHWAGISQIFFGASGLQAKEHGYLYTQLFYDSNVEKRKQEFNMTQIMEDEALAVWNS